MTALPSSPRASSPYHLTPEQTAQFHQEGYLAPLTACSVEEMAGHRTHIEQLLETPFVDHGADDKRHKSDAERMGALKKAWGHNRHLDDRPLWELSTAPAIVGAMQSLMGTDLLMWRTNFFTKYPGAKAIPWHQDRNYWPLEPEIVISAWLAIDACDQENSCLQVLPGSHRKLFRHVPTTEAMAFDEMADTDGLDLSKRVNMELQPGQFVLFSERTLHHSEENRSDRRRMGLSIRVVIPQVRVLRFDSPSHRLVQIAGSDPLGFSATCEPPSTAAF